MKTATFIVLTLLVGSSASAHQYWNDIRHSALLPDGTVTIRVENPTGAGDENYILFAQEGITEEAMSMVRDGPSTVSATVPGPTSEARYYGFRLLNGDEIDFMPVRVGDAVDPSPAFS